MTIRRDSMYGGGLVRRAMRILQLSGVIQAGGRTHNYSATDLPFEDTVCPSCERRFQEDNELVLIVRRVEAAQIFCVPAHRQCPEGQE